MTAGTTFTREELRTAVAPVALRTGSVDPVEGSTRDLTTIDERQAVSTTLD